MERLEDGAVAFSLVGAAAYRTAGAGKAVPGFDVTGYGLEDYVFGIGNAYLPDIFKTCADILATAFNSN